MIPKEEKSDRFSDYIRSQLNYILKTPTRKEKTQNADTQLTSPRKSHQTKTQNLQNLTKILKAQLVNSELGIH